MGRTKGVTTSAIVTVTIEIEATGRWGDDCTVSQVHDQAGAETMQRLSTILQALSKGIVVGGVKRHMIARVVERPVVRAVIVKDR